MLSLITGNSGFIGRALELKTNLYPVDINALPRVHAKYFFHFASPSSQILFNEDYRCISETVIDFIRVVEYCKKRHIKLIFPSSATIYNNQNSYSHTKLALEEIAKAYQIDYLALRIFAGYGLGEEHKKDYASVIYQWIKQMKKGERPVIFGDGKQTRDFVYITDIVDNIVNNLDKSGVIDIGTGINTSFNEIVKIINKELNTNIKPKYIGKPVNYINETICKNPIKNPINIKDGIKNIIDYE